MMSDRLTDRTARREELLAAARRHLEYGAGPQGPPAGKAALTTAIQVPLPDGREVWVHPVSLEQAMWLNLRSAEAIAKLNLRTEEQVRTAHLYYGPVFQLIEACRVGPEPDAAPVFQPEDAEWLFRARGWLPVVRQIANLSDQLSGEEFLRSAFADFFAVWEQRLAMLSSRLSAASIPSCRQDLEALASFASLTRQRGTLSVHDMPELSDEGAGEAETEEA